MSDYSIVGKGLPKLDAWGKALGQSTYVADMSFPNMLHGKILRSPYAHARIINVDTSRARALKGVKAVITGKDILPVKFGIVPFSADQHALCIGKVRHVGDSVAAVAAVDEETAEEALSLIKIDYELLPAVFDPEESVEEGAPAIHEGVKNNTSASLVRNFGDIEMGFRESDVVREDDYRTQPNNHAPIEPHGCISIWHPEDKVTIWCATQIPFFLRRNLAKAVGLDERSVRVIKTIVGGGFGQKIDMFASDVCATLLSRLTGRPVRIIINREEVFLSTRQRHPMHITVKTGAKKDGALMAQYFKLVADGGAYNSTAPLVITASAYFLMIPYMLANLRYEGAHVYTNKPVGGAMRGHGIPQARFAVESHLDNLALDLGMDPVDLRMKNAIYVGYKHPAKYRINTCGFRDALTEVAQHIDWKAQRGKGVGIAGSSFPCGAKNMSHLGAGGIVQINIDGGVNIMSGAADIGQGTETVLAQIAAEELGTKYENVRVTCADTGLTPLDAGTFGSGVTFRAGNAMRAAAADARRQLQEVMADKLEASPDDIVFRDDRVYVKGSPDRGMSFTEAVKHYRYLDKPMPVVGRGFYMPDADEPTTLLKQDGNFSVAYTFIAQAAQVQVDRETGQVELDTIVTAHDCGFMLNPLNVEGQLEGSVAGGVGMAFYEDLPHVDGQYLNPNLIDYKIPTCTEIPRKLISIPIETDEPLGPFGAKESGEGNQVATAPAIANAILDAIGAQIKELPLTPERVLNAIAGKTGPGI
ncbi:MAG: xanthine dehydrogenase family protein molybdopterin-binding subunit [Dehalococcoidia bacterium]|nr:xanthine dehydrogenase family protein molybdopterin-binding subunit [Dehalococcoidia bacterium]